MNLIGALYYYGYDDILKHYCDPKERSNRITKDDSLFVHAANKQDYLLMKILLEKGYVSKSRVKKYFQGYYYNIFKDTKQIIFHEMIFNGGGGDDENIEYNREIAFHIKKISTTYQLAYYLDLTHLKENIYTLNDYSIIKFKIIIDILLDIKISIENQIENIMQCGNVSFYIYLLKTSNICKTKKIQERLFKCVLKIGTTIHQIDKILSIAPNLYCHILILYNGRLFNSGDLKHPESRYHEQIIKNDYEYSIIKLYKYITEDYFDYLISKKKYYRLIYILIVLRDKLSIKKYHKKIPVNIMDNITKKIISDHKWYIKPSETEFNKFFVKYKSKKK